MSNCISYFFTEADMKEKILIIEDDPLIRNELKTLLQSNGYETVAPEKFADVIDRIKAEQPHLILLDIKLPGTSGFSLCTEIRTFSEVPIIFVTSCNTDMDELNSIMLGGFFYIFLRNQMIQKENEAQRLQLEKIKNDQLQTELKFLKAQYHPHFLFNVLNTVYFQIDENNEAPRHTLEQLSDLLRYQLYNDGEKVQVRVELEYLKQYISLCKLRATKRLQLQVHFDEMEAQVEIYPLLFVPLVENAFKYVGGNYFIAMDMCLKEGKLCFSIENSIPEPLVHQKGKHGIGIENLRRRLELLYPERHTLDINRGDTLFRVKLVIEL